MRKFLMEIRIRTNLPIVNIIEIHLAKGNIVAEIS